MCLYPKTIFVPLKGAYGKLKLLEGVVGHPVELKRKVTVACGHCLECLKDKSVEWAFRIVHEASFYSANCFITLTYDDKHMNYNEFGEPSVDRREVQLFMKRLRKLLSPQRVRFFACGEYGSKYGRPHYHLIIFNWLPSDIEFFRRDGSDDLYRSRILEQLWPKGFSSVGKLSFQSALYCAKYMNKILFDKHYLPKPKFEQVVVGPNPSFVQMSTRPGIGFDYVYRVDLKSDKVYVNGRAHKIPRYYLKVMERDGIYLDEFQQRRETVGQKCSEYSDIDSRRKKYDDLFKTVRVKRL